MRLWLVLLLFFTGRLNNSVVAQNPYPDCVKQAVGNGEIVKIKELDVDNKGELDQVVLFKNDRLYILLALNPTSDNCTIVLNEHLTSLALVSGQQTVEVHEIEMVELTGDAQPELHVWVDKIGGGRFVSASVHTIYTAGAGNWEEALHIEQCLAFNSFKFQDSPIDNTKNIYRDTDIVCDPPFSTDRNYDIFRWNGSKFVSIENGTAVVWSLNSPIWYSICIATLVGLALIIILIATNFRKRHQFDKT